MYKKILVPLDGSKRAEAILPHIEELALTFGAQVILLQVIEPHYVYTSFAGYETINVEAISREAKTHRVELYLSALVEEFREKGIIAKSIIEYESVAHTIMKIAEHEEVDLIAMASHGRTGLARVFYGSVAASLIHLVDRPLLIVRAEVSD